MARYRPKAANTGIATAADNAVATHMLSCSSTNRSKRKLKASHTVAAHKSASTVTTSSRLAGRGKSNNSCTKRFVMENNGPGPALKKSMETNPQHATSDNQNALPSTHHNDNAPSLRRPDYTD